MSMEWPTDVFSWIGLTALVYGGVLLGCKLGAFGWAVLYPHVLGRAKDLRKLAGAKWAAVFGGNLDEVWGET
ncbi:hypothetical protein M3Y99_00231300 [Aphelenchoides fujianensis]|nr:hypothetical protein M3Y99_00231300 [Aphelenchoides fujianensis]